MKDLLIGVVGGGVVGRATARTYLEHVKEVRVYDVLPQRSTHSLAEVLACHPIFVCLPSPQKEDSLECDLSAILGFFKERLESMRDRFAHYVLRSTVPIGTTEIIREMGIDNIVHCPEFLTARCAMTDALVPARNIIGGKPGSCASVLVHLLEHRFPRIPMVRCTSQESEAIKLYCNTVFAVKVGLFNELQELSSKLGLCWETVLEGMLLDGRIGSSHTKVPGPDGLFGFGGECLKKDLANLIHTIYQNDGLSPHVTLATYLRNLKDRERTA